MNRRQFTGHLVMGAAAGTMILGAAVELDGCSATSVFNDILNWIPVGEASLQSILAVLASNGIVLSPGGQAIVTAIEAAITAVEAAVKEYEATNPPPVGALQKVEAALKAVIDQFQTFLGQLALPGGNILTLISGLAGIVFSTIQAFLNQLPTSATTTVMASVERFRLNGVEYKVVSNRSYMARRHYKRAWNGQLSAASSNGVSVPADARLRLSFFEHF